MTAADLDLDREARRLAQLEFRRPLLLEAGAGTGKTATLVNRVLSWCLEPGWQRAAGRVDARPPAVLETRHDDERIAAAVWRGVIAITFTEAAAGEMAQRVLRGVDQVRRGETPVGFAPPFALDEEHRRRAAALLACSEQLQIRTIHAFCRKLLAEHPFEAGLHPSFTIDADGTLVRELAEETVEASLGEAYDEPGDDDFLLLASRGHGPLEIAEVLTRLAAAGLPEGALGDDLHHPDRVKAVLDRLRKVVDRLLTLLEVRRLGRRAPNAVAIVRSLDRLRQRLRLFTDRPPPIAEVHRWLDRHFPPPLIEHLAIWARGETANQTEDERLGPVIDTLSALADAFRRLERHLRQLDPVFLASAVRVLGALLARVRREMRQRGVVSFADLLRSARDLLHRHPSVRRRLRLRIEQLLIDEFQDTDALQCDLIRDLALTGAPGERPGLFVVGDPKQSIYGWRSADLEAYESFVEALLAAGGERRPLVENFRSAPQILSEVEHAIAPIMRRRPGLQPDFHPLLPCDHRLDTAFRPAVQQTASRRRCAVEYWLSWSPSAEDPARPAEGSAVDTARLEAGLLARDLLGLHREAGVAWSEIGVLMRSFTDLEIYLAALREAGVPFAVSRDRHYYRRREIIDAAALVRTVLAPDDHLALLTFLRSSAVGVPDAALIPLWAGHLPRLLTDLERTDLEALQQIARLAEDVARDLPPNVPGLDRVAGWEANLIHAARCLAVLRNSAETDPADLFVERLRTLTLFEGSESTRYLGSHRIANLDRFFADLLFHLEASGGDRHRLLRRLRALIGQAHEAEEAQPGEAGEDAVRILTIHQAKGLEFPHLYLLQTHKAAGRRQREPFAIGFHQGRLEVRLFGVPTAGFDLLEDQRQRLARAELVRTLYVAMTRAEQRLVIVGRPSPGSRPTPVERAETHAELLAHRRGPGPTTAELVEHWQRQRSEVDDGDRVWYLGGLDRTPAERWTEETAVEWPPVAVLEVEQRQLSEARARARQEMERPFRVTVSGHLAQSETGLVAWEDTTPALESTSEPADPATALDRRLAALAGRTLHHLIETCNLAADPDVENERLRRELEPYLRSIAPENEARQAIFRTRRLLERVLAGRLLQRLRDLHDRIMARELPILLPPAGSPAGADPAGYVGGVIDLVYRDEGSLVVVDFKTSGHDLPSSVRERHFAQAEVYRRALEAAWGSEVRSRVEIWYLGSDVVLGLRPSL